MKLEAGTRVWAAEVTPIPPQYRHTVDVAQDGRLSLTFPFGVVQLYTDEAGAVKLSVDVGEGRELAVYAIMSDFVVVTIPPMETNAHE